MDPASQFAALFDIPQRLSAIERSIRNLTDLLQEIRKSLPPKLVSVETAAEALEVSESTVRRWIKSGDIPYTKIGGSIRIDLAAFRPKSEQEIASLAREALKR